MFGIADQRAFPKCEENIIKTTVDHETFNLLIKLLVYLDYLMGVELR